MFKNFKSPAHRKLSLKSISVHGTAKQISRQFTKRNRFKNYFYRIRAETSQNVDIECFLEIDIEFKFKAKGSD